jgi:hypothetical protein
MRQFRFVAMATLMVELYGVDMSCFSFASASDRIFPAAEGGCRENRIVGTNFSIGEMNDHFATVLFDMRKT